MKYKDYYNNDDLLPETKAALGFNENYQNDTISTQVSGTYGTYVKTGKLIKTKVSSGAKILNFGAGLDQTRQGLLDGLGDGEYTIDDFEPNPSRRKSPPEYTDSSQIPSNAYDAVVCHNVLNVLQPDIRIKAVESMFDAVKSGGIIIIGVRDSAAISTIKNFDPSDEESAKWVKKGKNKFSYQKGYSKNELEQYIKNFAAEKGYVVNVDTLSGIAGASVLITVKSKK